MYITYVMLPLPSRLFNLRSNLPSNSCVEHTRDLLLSQQLRRPLDRINILGNDAGTYGHTGYAKLLELRLSILTWFKMCQYIELGI